MRSAVLVSLISTGFLCSSVCAADLLQLYQEALTSDASYASARTTLVANREKEVQGRSSLLPSVSVNGNYGRNTQEVVAADADSRYDFSGNSYTIAISQALFRVANWEIYQQAKLAVAAGEAQFTEAQQDLIVRVAQAYFDVLASQEVLESVRAQKAAISEQLAYAKQNYEVGTTIITDVHEAQARYDLVLAQEISAQNDLQIKRSALQYITGKKPDTLAPLRKDANLNLLEPQDMNQWVERAEALNYGVVNANLALEIADRDIKRSRAGHYPTVDLVITRNHIYQGANSTTVAGAVNTNTIGVQWAIPIFSGFSVDSKVRESIALKEKARADLENARRTATQSVRQAFLSVNAGLAQVRALEAAEVSNKTALESNRLGYQVGVRINIDVLNAQQQLYAVQRDLSKARYDVIVSNLRLKFTAGTLREDDLVLINNMLSHQANN